MSRRLLLPCITLNILFAFATPDRSQCYPTHTMTLLLGLLTLSCCAYVSIISSDAVTTNPESRYVPSCFLLWYIDYTTIRSQNTQGRSLLPSQTGTTHTMRGKARSTWRTTDSTRNMVRPGNIEILRPGSQAERYSRSHRQKCTQRAELQFAYRLHLRLWCPGKCAQSR
jgi:hypothetical protein